MKTLTTADRSKQTDKPENAGPKVRKLTIPLFACGASCAQGKQQSSLFTMYIRQPAKH